MLEVRVEGEKTLSKEEKLTTLSYKKMDVGNFENNRENGKEEDEKDERGEEDN